MIVTKKEYEKAQIDLEKTIDVINKYHEQIRHQVKLCFEDVDIIKSLSITTTPDAFLEYIQTKASTRLYNIIKQNRVKWNNLQIVTKEEYLESRNTGGTSWDEFQKLLREFHNYNPTNN